ncbi:MAG: phosphoribosylaminoimidazolesuccinocarboxamide synthase [Planctomycetes bacterium]|nr:phosphoribosylaminoimidazolesuccinocarboxamide synthase [Planctomycetota bacterium]
MVNTTDALMRTDLPLPNRRQGKVRDIYDMTLPDGSPGLLIVATDRISAFDVVMSNGVPGKGVVLTQISVFWFDMFKDLVPHHLVSTDPADIPGISAEQAASLKGRVMIGRKTNVIPVECIVRGYLTGSGFKDYTKTGKVCGIPLPAGMVNSSKIENPIFTPSTKAETGHDENISFDTAAATVGENTAAKLRDLSLQIYSEARNYAAKRGIIIADTKFEFGLPIDPSSGAGPILIDEVLTPDSSRFWPADEYAAGREQNSLDKQYVRNYLEGLVKSGGWDKTPPGPALPDDVIENTLAKYKDAYHRLTGKSIDDVL